MILPIHTYGAPVLREVAKPIEQLTPELDELIDNMLETMQGAAGIGLAAPQVGRSVRLFVVDLRAIAEELAEEGEEVPPQPMVFCNPAIREEMGPDTEFEEGCLSIPNIREEVERAASVRVDYRDRDWQMRTLDASGMLARVILHEFDHLEGVLFVDHLSSFRRSLLRRKLREMTEGVIDADYPVAVPT